MSKPPGRSRTGREADRYGTQAAVRNINSAVYHRIDRASASRLEAVRRSLAYARFRIDHPQPPTQSMRLGTAAHAAILEPERFRTFPRTPKTPRRRTGTPRDQVDPDAVSVSEWNRAERIAEAVRAHPLAAGLLDHASAETELSLFWTQPTPSGRPLDRKARLDYYNPALAIAADIKVTFHAPTDFPDAAIRAGYHRQAAYYLGGLEALGFPCDSFLLLAVAPTPPHEARLYQLTGETLRAGRLEVETLADLYARALASGDWNQEAAEIQPIRLPRWTTPTPTRRTATV